MKVITKTSKEVKTKVKRKIPSKMILLKNNVFDETIERINWIFDRFGRNATVSFSGGKDSTVTLEMMLIVARKRNMLPLKVLFLDEEAEWQATIDYMNKIMARDEIEPIWLQIPFRLDNASSSDARTHMLHVFDPDKKDQWIHPYSEFSKPYRENIYGANEFIPLMRAVQMHLFSQIGLSAGVGGVRIEESPARRLGLTTHPVMDHVTWGKILDQRKKRTAVVLYPLYDWRTSDIWKAIHDNNWDYCKLYDKMYRYGVHQRNMRISSLIHETAIRSLWMLQELEPLTYARVIKRIDEVHSLESLGQDAVARKALPFMFSTWREYRNFLMEKLIPEDEWGKFYHKFQLSEKQAGVADDWLMEVHVRTILLHDDCWTVLRNHMSSRRMRDRGKTPIEENK